MSTNTYFMSSREGGMRRIDGLVKEGGSWGIGRNQELYALYCDTDMVTFIKWNTEAVGRPRV